MGIVTSYSLTKICIWMNDHNMKYVFVSPNFTTLPMVIIQTGLKVTLNENLLLSVQTDPMIAGMNFAITALQNKNGFVSSSELGYPPTDGVINHTEPEDLFTHITSLLKKLKDLGPTFGPDLKVISNKRQSDEKCDDCDPDPKKRKNDDTENESDGDEDEDENV